MLEPDLNRVPVELDVKGAERQAEVNDQVTRLCVVDTAGVVGEVRRQLFADVGVHQNHADVGQPIPKKTDIRLS